jgi:hypothetical protein
MNVEAQTITYPTAQQAKFQDIQEVDAMFEATQTAKKELCEFKPVVQTAYAQMQQVKSVEDTKWDTLLATKPQQPDVVATHGSIVGASILVRKWQASWNNMNFFSRKPSRLYQSWALHLKKAPVKKLKIDLG